MRGQYAAVAIAALMAGTQATVDEMVNDPAVDTGQANTQSETAIGTHGDLVVIGFNDSGELARGLGITGYGYSVDGGQTFRDAGALPARAGTTNDGDPVIAVDGDGRFLFGTLASEDASVRSFIGVARSRRASGVVSFDPPVLIAGLDPDGFQDKEWVAADATKGPHAGNAYVVWTEFHGQPRQTRILFSRSLDHGATFTPAVQLSSPGTAVQGASVSVGPDGELFAAWVEYLASGKKGLRLRRSGDGGATFGRVVPVTEFDFPGETRATQSCDANALNGDIHVNGFPSLDVDRSSGPGRGRVFIAFAGRTSGSTDAASVFVTWSGNGGLTWSPAASVVAGSAVTSPDPSSRDNWAPAVVVASNGSVSVFFYDRRNDPQNRRIELYRAKSTDQGATWANERVSTQPFVPPVLNPHVDQSLRACYFGDYNGVATAGTAALVVWGDARRVTLRRPDIDVRFGTIK